MNKVYTTVWNAALGAWVVASEHARGRGKGNSRSAGVASALAALLFAAPLVATAQASVTLTGSYTSATPPTSPTWTTGGMQIGMSGQASGILMVSGGGQVISSSQFEATIGGWGGTGTATITGVGSSWQSTAGYGNWRIGYTENGQATVGSFNILDGATATGNSFSVVGQGTNGVGTANVSGNGSAWTVNGNLVIGNGIDAQAGPIANGTVTVSNGGVINTPILYMAYTNDVGDAASSGTLNIGAAAGSAAAAPGTLNASSVVIGSGPGAASASGNTGTINFNHTSTDGSYAFAPAISSNGVGTATINQLAGYTTLTGDSSGFSGTTNVVGGTLDVTGKLGSTASMLNVGGGLLWVSGGGSIASNQVGIGAAAGTSGKALVDGAGSSITSTDGLYVGLNGSGELDITNRGTVASGAAAFIGGINGTASGSGIANVTGPGSKLATSAGLFVGSGGGNGTLTVSNGGTLDSSGNTFLGFADGGQGAATLTVTGAGSAWTEANQARIGYSAGASAASTLNVLNGATATVGDFAIVGMGVGSRGVANVSGSGSVWNAGSGQGLVIGNGIDASAGPLADGTVTISNGGVVNAPVVYMAYGNAANYASSGTLNIGAAPSSTAAAPGTLNAASVIMGSGPGAGNGANISTLNFNHTSTDGSYVFAPAISSNAATSASIHQLAGNTNLTGNSAGFGGITGVTGGTLRVNGTLGNAASTVNVSSGGTLGGAGTIGGSVAIGDGVLSPGNSPGTLTINGNLALSSGSQLNYELGAPGTAGGPLNDLTIVKGNLTLDGTLNVTQSAGGTFGAGIYRLIDYSGSLTDNGLALGNMPAGSDNYVQTSVAQQVNLVNTRGLTLNYWDGDAGGKNDGLVAGGDGTWRAGPTGPDRWTSADGKVNAPYQDAAFAVFSGAPGTVAVDNSLGAVRVSGMQFATSGYRVQGGDIELTAGTNAIRVGDGTAAGAGTTATIASALTGAGRLDKVDLGTLVLTGSNSYAGGTQISSGTLQLGDGGTSGSLPAGNVANNGVLAFNRSDAVTFTGAIGGSGAVSQLGAGSTTLAAANSYSGGTTISAGTLVGSATSFGSGAITSNAALVVSQSADAAMANALNGTGSFIKTGAGVLDYTGSGTLSGATRVAQGTLAVNGALASSAVNVAGGAILAGNGTVGAATLERGAIVAPGNAGIGTLTIRGNFRQAAGSMYQVQVLGGSNTADTIHAVGAATLEGGAALQVARIGSGAYALDTRYTALTADGGITGTYASLMGDTRSAFVQLFDTYDANHVYLTAKQVRAFVAAGLTPNQIATAGALDTVGSNAMHNALALLPTDAAARGAFDSLSGELHASVQTAILEDSRFVREAANDRLLGAFCAPGTSEQIQRQPSANPSPAAQPGATGGTCVPSGELTAWGRVFGSTGHVNGDGNAARLDRDIGGFFVGADAGLAGGWRVGALGGYSRSNFDVDARSSSAKADTYTLGAYGGNQWGATAVRLGASYSWHRLDTQRGVNFPGYADSLSAKYDASTMQVFGEVGHRLEVGNGVAIEPFAGLAVVKVKGDSFTERGGYAALAGAGGDADSTFGTLGARFSAQMSDSTKLRAMLGWRHAFGSGAPTSNNSYAAGSASFTISGVPLSRNVGVVEAGLETRPQANLRLSVSYAGQFGGRLNDNGVKVTLDWKF